MPQPAWVPHNYNKTAEAEESLVKRERERERERDFIMTSVKTITMAVLVALIGSASAARPSTTSILVRPNELATNKHVIDAVNSNDTMPWVAGENEMFKGMTMDEAKKLLGTFM